MVETSPAVLFYDGHSRLAHSAVRLLLHSGAGKHFRFAPTQGTTFAARVQPEVRAALPDSMVVQTPAGAILLGVDAWIYVLRRIGGFSTLLGKCLDLIPRALSNLVYRFVARTRYALGTTASLYPSIPGTGQKLFDP